MKHIKSAGKDVASAGQGDEGRIHVGISVSLASNFMTSLIENYTNSHPKVRLEFIEGTPLEHIQAIRTHQLDVAFLTGSPHVSGCETRQLWSEQVFVAMPEDDNLAVHESITWRELQGRRFVVCETWPGPEIHDFLIKHLSEPGHQPSVKVQAVYRDNLMQMVASGGNLTLVSEAATAMLFPGVLYRQLASETVPFCTVWSPTNDNPACRRLLSLARTLSDEQIATGK
ncbi:MULTISPECIES: LysR family substrate-binding domain-containing protein [Pseudochelatococcus]|uniref:DNA-binding transcriptional LysR family regulator n=1 Tax=Pseudochelatococcus contaminans TaxID=1538103 RepID=A0A7W5Z737_9HYPH|nr:LysR family substrate-binding domain-containing protein [Pseudochelatococcus contaminans]MBB3810909.1 DNA-binding transcriptional LysR family regulator [Pseudochelatococcus contaminans]